MKSLIAAIIAVNFLTAGFVDQSEEVETEVEEIQESIITYPFGVAYNVDESVLQIYGETSRFQLFSVGAVLQEYDVQTVMLAGPGGDFYAGLTMGDMLQEENVHIIVPHNSICASACAMMALAGNTIQIQGRLLFHAPFMPYVPINVDIQEIAQVHGLVYLDMNEYIERMGFHTYFTRTMLERTSFCEFILITRTSDLQAWRDNENFVYSIDIDLDNNMCDD